MGRPRAKARLGQDDLRVLLSREPVQYFLCPCVAVSVFLRIFLSMRLAHFSFIWDGSSPLRPSCVPPVSRRSARASLAFLWAPAPRLSLSRPSRVRLREVLLPRRGAGRHQRSARQPDHAGEWGHSWMGAGWERQGPRQRAEPRPPSSAVHTVSSACCSHSLAKSHGCHTVIPIS